MSTLYYDTLPPAETLPNTPLISAPPLPPLNLPIDDTLNFSISGLPDPFYVPNTQTPTCNCEQSSSSCNCPTPTPEERGEYQRIHDEYLTRQIQTVTDNKKYMYIAGGLIIALFIFSKK